MSKLLTTGDLSARVAKGWKPNMYLTSMSMAYFMQPADYVAPTLFPICRVQNSTGFYYKFSKADLARDDVKRKPAFGKVDPAIMGQTEDSYRCYVDQVILGIDQISSLDYSRSRAPGVADPRSAKVRTASEKMHIHLDAMFGKSFFKSGVWGNELAGVDAGAGSNQFIKFSNDNSTPIKLIDQLALDTKRNGRRRPNKLALGANVFPALKNHPEILDRVKYMGSSANPASVTTNALAQLFGVQQVVVMESTYNAAALGQEEDMQFICSPNDALLVYATDAPAIDEPSAGYIFTWDMLGDGNYMAMDQWEGENGTHSEFIEGLMSTDMRKTGDDLAVYLKDCV